MDGTLRVGISADPDPNLDLRCDLDYFSWCRHPAIRLDSEGDSG
jgi:hypothetical protein